MKTFATLALAALAFGSVSAQEKEAKLKVLSDIKFSGYIMSQYQYSDKESNKGEKDINSFNIRMVRMALEGRLAGDFYWKAQLQVNATRRTSPWRHEWWTHSPSGRSTTRSR